MGDNSALSSQRRGAFGELRVVSGPAGTRRFPPPHPNHVRAFVDTADGSDSARHVHADLLQTEPAPASSCPIPPHLRCCLEEPWVKVKRLSWECGESRAFDSQHVRGNSTASHLDGSNK